MPSAAHAQSRVHTCTLTPHKHAHARSRQKRLISLQELSTASRETGLKTQKQAAVNRLSRHIRVWIQAVCAIKGRQQRWTDRSCSLSYFLEQDRYTPWQRGAQLRAPLWGRGNRPRTASERQVVFPVPCMNRIAKGPGSIFVSLFPSFALLVCFLCMFCLKCSC